MSSELLLGVLLLTVCLGRPPAPAPAVGGKVFLTVDEALELAFPECAVERGTQFLSEELRERVAELAKLEFDDGIAHPYVARKDGELVGTAYFDTHRVRTLRETVMFVVDPEGKIARFELLSFGEPLDYVPRDAWYAQFVGRPLDDELNLKRSIRPVSGASLTARATTEAARRTLALHQVLGELEAERARKKREKEKQQGTGGGDGEGGDPPPPDGAEDRSA